MKFKTTYLVGALALTVSLTVFNSCKREQQVTQIKSVESVEVKDLKQFMARIGEVNVSEVDYDSNKDQFSINGKAVISRTDLKGYYENNINNPKPQRFIMGQPTHTVK